MPFQAPRVLASAVSETSRASPRIFVRPAGPASCAALAAVCALTGVTASCSNPVLGDVPRPGSESGAITLSTEPEAALDAAPPVLRFHARYAPHGPPPELALFAGALSDYHLRRVRDRDLPGTLLERQIPCVLWEVEAGHAVLAPRLPLDTTEPYTVVALGSGAVATVSVREDQPLPHFARLWPTPETPFAGDAVYCSAGGSVPPAQAVELAPVPLLGDLTPGVGRKFVAAERCFQLHAAAPSDFTFLLPPPRVADASIDPAPLQSGPLPASAPAVCIAPEQALGPACLEVADDRLFVRTAPEAALLAVHATGVDSLQTLPAGGRFAVRGFAPSSVVAVDFTLLTASGVAWAEARDLTTASPRPRVVVNEVLANPSGAEPQQEWVEIVNDGSARVDLGGFTFADGGGELPLPAAVLEPGQFALIVAEEFQPAGLGDVPVPEACLLIRLPKLGKNGLSNGGESVRLRSPDAQALSQFPGLASPKAGVSLARRDVAASDSDASSFALHGAPGASPCAANF